MEQSKKEFQNCIWGNLYHGQSPLPCCANYSKTMLKNASQHALRYSQHTPTTLAALGINTAINAYDLYKMNKKNNNYK